MKYCYYLESNINKIDKSNWEYDEKNPDIVFTFGGDGTLLKAVHKYINNIDNILFVGIKLGKLGFFYTYDSNDFLHVIDLIENGNVNIRKLNLLSYNINNEISGFALNEIAITNPIHTQIIDVYINDNLFEKFRGTGFICSPPAGSTAYSRSMGGSIISPDIEAFQLVEIASINNKLFKTIGSPLVLSKNYDLKLVPINKENIYISVDGIEVKSNPINVIKVGLSDKKVNIMNIDEDFFVKVRKSFLD